MKTLMALVLALVPAMAWADPICAYVTGTVGGQSFSTPAVPIYVPDTQATVQPVRVHVDPTTQTILGYSVRTPGEDQGTDEKTVFVPGVDTSIPSIVATIPELGITTYRCLDAGVSTPAIPVFVPASALTTPGVVTNVPSIELNALDHDFTTCGQTISLPGKTIVIPSQSAMVPSVSATTPEETLIVVIDGTQYPSHYLPSR
jgi:hypothetical protein